MTRLEKFSIHNEFEKNLHFSEKLRFRKKTKHFHDQERPKSFSMVTARLNKKEAGEK